MNVPTEEDIIHSFPTPPSTFDMQVYNFHIYHHACIHYLSKALRSVTTFDPIGFRQTTGYIMVSPATETC